MLLAEPQAWLMGGDHLLVVAARPTEMEHLSTPEITIRGSRINPNKEEDTVSKLFGTLGFFPLPDLEVIRFSRVEWS